FECKKQRLVGPRGPFGIGGRQIHRKVDGRERRRNNKNNQQTQNHADERRDVDFVDLAQSLVAVIETHTHNGYSAATARRRSLERCSNVPRSRSRLIIRRISAEASACSAR